MQGFWLKSFGKVDFLWIYILICRLLGRLFGFEGLIDHGADEVVKAEIALRGVGGFVYRGLRVGTGAASGGQLGFITLAVVDEQGEGFLFGEVLGARRKDGDSRCFFGLFGIDDLFGHKTGLAEEVGMLQFRALRRVFLVVARIADGIGLLYGKEFYVCSANSRAALTPNIVHRTLFGAALPLHVDNTTVIVTVFLHSVDDAFAFKCAVNLTDRVFKDGCCHVACGYPRKRLKTLF